MLMHFTSNFTGQLLAPASARLEVLETIVLFIVGISVSLLMNRMNQNTFQLDSKKSIARKLTF
jgi:hypothetical protein